jgi:hypothetical protein
MHGSGYRKVSLDKAFKTMRDIGQGRKHTPKG